MAGPCTSDTTNLVTSKFLPETRTSTSWVRIAKTSSCHKTVGFAQKLRFLALYSLIGQIRLSIYPWNLLLVEAPLMLLGACLNLALVNHDQAICGMIYQSCVVHRLKLL